jgi:hypothetical protein
MNRLVLVFGLAIVGCGEVEVAREDGCAPGTHDEDGAYVADTTCLDSSCNGHGSCSATATETVCACDEGYLGDNCTECAAGFEEAGGLCEPVVCGGLHCGAFGACSEASGSPTCECNSAMTGASCDQCAAPAGRLVWDTIGGAGNHHTIAIAPGDIVVAQLPSLPVTSNGPQAAGSWSFAEVPSVPDGWYKLAFSRCPGDMSAFAETQNRAAANGTPCAGDFVSRTGLLSWVETGAPNNFHCYLPPGEGPWYVNLRVDPAAVTACQEEVGHQCVINWQWN